MRVIVMRGLPGSGKSTVVQQEFPSAVICSADHYFIGKDGVYRYDPTKIGEAHRNCFRKFLEVLQLGEQGMLTADAVVVDNTNISPVEIAPYMQAASAYGAEARLITVQCDPTTSAARNTHGVPADIIARMAVALEKAEIPEWWTHEVR